MLDPPEEDTHTAGNRRFRFTRLRRISEAGCRRRRHPAISVGTIQPAQVLRRRYQTWEPQDCLVRSSQLDLRQVMVFSEPDNRTIAWRL